MHNANDLPWTEAKASAETVARKGWSLSVPPEQVLTAKTAPAAESIAAYANHGRWVVACPDCDGAQIACPDDRRFMCNECGNVSIGGLWRPVVWPKDRAKIDALLNLRPRNNQHWVPGETLADLREENESNGVGR